jgi:hypothetical protein
MGNMKTDKTESALIQFIIFGLMANIIIAIILGIHVRSFWVALLVILSFVLAFATWLQICIPLRVPVIIVFTLAIMSVGALIWATYLAEFKGGWLWAPICIVLGAMHIFNGWSSKNHETPGLAFLFYYILSPLFIVTAFLGPITLLNQAKSHYFPALVSPTGTPEVAIISPEPTSQPTIIATDTRMPVETPTQQPSPTEFSSPVETKDDVVQDQDDGISSLAKLVRNMFSSTWGIIYLVFFALIGQFTWRKWGGVLFLAGGVGIFALLSKLNPETFQALDSLLSANPVEIWLIMLRLSQGQFGSFVGIVFLMGLSLAVLSTPFQINPRFYAQVFAGGSKWSYSEKSADTWRVAGNILSVLTFSMSGISFWIAQNLYQLSELVGDQSIKNFARFGFQNFSSGVYYAVFLVFLALTYGILAVQKKIKFGLFAFFSGKLNRTSLFWICLVISLIIPTGVLVYLSGVFAGVLGLSFWIMKLAKAA